MRRSPSPNSSSPLRIGVGHDSRVTAKLMKDAICGGLSREGRIGELFEFGIRAAFRFAGNRVGKRKGKRSGT